jgi:hypothetical protein
MSYYGSSNSLAMEPEPTEANHATSQHSTVNAVHHKKGSIFQKAKVNVGRTMSGREWALHALHPAIHDHEYCPGFPGGAATDIALLHFTDELNFSPPPDADSDSIWNLDIVLSGSVFFTRTRYVKGGADATSYATYVPGDLTRAIATGDNGRSLYKGVTLVLDGPALADQGTIYAAQTPATFTQEFVNSVHLSVTDSDAPPGQAAGRQLIRFNTIRVEDSPTAGPGMSPLFAVDPSNPVNGHRILQQSPRSFEGAARDGVYIPCRLALESNEYRPSSGVVSFDLDIKGSGLPGTLKGFQPIFGPESLNADSALSVGKLGVFDNFASANVTFENMSTKSRIRGVYRTGYEIAPSPTSPYVYIKRSAPCNDSMAVEDYVNLSRLMQDAYPASYNDGNGLWSTIKSLARAVGPIIGTALGGPAGGALANTLVEGAAGVGDAIAGNGESKKKKKAKAVAGAGVVEDLARAEHDIKDAEKALQLLKADAKKKKK